MRFRLTENTMGLQGGGIVRTLCVLVLIVGVSVPTFGQVAAFPGAGGFGGGTASASGPETLQVHVKSVDFLPPQPVQQDPTAQNPNGVPYPATDHWLDSNDDDDAADQGGDHRFPVMFQRGTPVLLGEVTLRMKAGEPPAGPMTLRGEGPNGLQFTGAAGFNPVTVESRRLQ